MENPNQTFGIRAEEAAVDFLRRHGYRILQRNFRNRLGEIDVIAAEGKTIVFVEVKARRSIRFGSAKAAVTARKQRKLSIVALSYLKIAGLPDAKARFDVVTITGEGPDVQAELVRNAFELAYP